MYAFSYSIEEELVQAAIRESMDAVVCNAPLSDESNASVSNVHDTIVSYESSASVSNENSANVLRRLCYQLILSKKCV